MHNHDIDIKYMQRCLELAKIGIGNVAPNPMVGSVIVCNNRIIGEGYHMQYGGNHAEVNAINSVLHKDLLKKSTLYVNLEPCSHHGNTPPCSDRIIEEKIPNVVIGTTDTNSLVAGKGIERMRKAGIQVRENILSRECFKLNKRFFTFHEKKRPYIILKWAESADGFMDIERNENTSKEPFWISNSISRMITHRWRSQEQAIMVGYNTVLNDNPSLTTRDWPGSSPIRIVIDPELKLSHSAKVFHNDAKTFVFSKHQTNDKENTRYFMVSEKKEFLISVIQKLHELKIQSIIIEGGKATLERFMQGNLWDEARVFRSNQKMNSGLRAPNLNIRPENCLSIKDDCLCYYYNLY